LSLFSASSSLAAICLLFSSRTGIKSIKLYAWERSFLEKLMNIRTNELGMVRHNVYLQAVSGVLFVVSPVLVALATFVTYSFTGAC
jgi:hypothetical protein